MSYEITGRLVQKSPEQVVNDKFKKREFVIEISEEIGGNTYTNFAKLQLVQNKCDLINNFNEGDMVRVNFNIKGNRWEKDGRVNYITNLDAWRIEAAGATQSTNAPQSAPQGYAAPNNNYGNSTPMPPSSDDVDDLPF